MIFSGVPAGTHRGILTGIHTETSLGIPQSVPACAFSSILPGFSPRIS